MPREQAEVVAKGVTRMFIHNFDTLVTRDYLDTRFTEFETRIEAKMDRRFAAVDVRFERMQGRFNLVYWMQGLTLACVVVPLIRSFLG
ncbi:MAG: hypothetical protein H6991_09980 [Pseudomonadales bacterium]|nr:hypothetical protein [Pseudomonadales bacterium]MCP5188086.1 hypothetical protein [Pseudomonadales bacterium]